MSRLLPYWVILFICIVIYFIPLASHARWPMFTPPDKTFLINQNWIDTRECPPGQGKLIVPQPIPIQEPFCHRICPQQWMWVAQSDANCHDLERDFNFQGYDIVHHGTGSDETLYSTVTAHYSHPAISFVMETEHDNHWYCYEMNPELRIISCANDM